MTWRWTWHGPLKETSMANTLDPTQNVQRLIDDAVLMGH